MIFREADIRSRHFQLITSRRDDDFDIDIYAATDGTEIQVRYGEDSVPDRAEIFAPNTDTAAAVTGRSGSTLSPEAVETMIYELLDDDPQIIFRLTGLTASDVDVDESMSLG